MDEASTPTPDGKLYLVIIHGIVNFAKIYAFSYPRSSDNTVIHLISRETDSTASSARSLVLLFPVKFIHFPATRSSFHR